MQAFDAMHWAVTYIKSFCDKGPSTHTGNTGPLGPTGDKPTIKSILGGFGNTSLSYSYDGLTFTPVPNSNSLISRIKDIKWNGLMWIAIGSTVVYSYDV